MRKGRHRVFNAATRAHGGPLHGRIPRSTLPYFDPFWPISPLTPNQTKIVKAIIHPEALLSLDYAKDRRAEPTVKVLDARQESLARKIGGGHRLVFGAAGSGKTVLLLARAKLLARFNPSARVLVLCYNVTFGAYMAEALRHCPTVTVAAHLLR